MSRPRPIYIDEATRAQYQQYELDLMKPRGPPLSSSERSRRFRARRAAKEYDPRADVAPRVSGETVKILSKNTPLRSFTRRLHQGTLAVIQYSHDDGNQDLSVAMEDVFQERPEDGFSFEHFGPGLEGVEAITQNDTSGRGSERNSAGSASSPAVSNETVVVEEVNGAPEATASTRLTTTSHLQPSGSEAHTLLLSVEAPVIENHSSPKLICSPTDEETTLSSLNDSASASVDGLSYIQDASSCPPSPASSFCIDIASLPPSPKLSDAHRLEFLTSPRRDDDGIWLSSFTVYIPEN
ncbi:hypothetical protein Moror_14962 [Moniliophthora roreri MCA 2997]|uniref:Uncharacterized protein n=1 Tax=Moniliophthora roreri (strain MCA 2997) TaxID=1381753 RepID=V2WTD0_MONRO|nr:hypothetical protein Moror_14962 [Moniliophthora roreri MCA 2997]